MARYLVMVAIAANPTPEPRAVKVAVIDFAAEGLGKDAKTYARAFGELIQGEARNQKLDVIGRTDIEAMLGLEKMKDALGCSTTNCFAEIGGALGVDEIVSGSLMKLGSFVIVTAKRIDARRNRIIKSGQWKLAKDDADGLVALAPRVVADLFGNARDAIARENLPATLPASPATHAKTKLGAEQQAAVPCPHPDPVGVWDCVVVTDAGEETTKVFLRADRTALFYGDTTSSEFWLEGSRVKIRSRSGSAFQTVPQWQGTMCGNNLTGIYKGVLPFSCIREATSAAAQPVAQSQSETIVPERALSVTVDGARAILLANGVGTSSDKLVNALGTPTRQDSVGRDWRWFYTWRLDGVDTTLCLTFTQRAEEWLLSSVKWF